MTRVYTADKIFTGERVLHDAAVMIEKDLIAGIGPSQDLPAGIPVTRHVPIVASACIDIQIYGAASALFSVYPVAETLVKMEEHCILGGTKYFLPTIASNTTHVIKRGIDAVREYWRLGGKSVPGLHIEGPWINPLKRGAHIESFIHKPTLTEAADLLEYGKGVIKMITLAPEVCSGEIIELIKSYGIIVSAGHSNATFEEAMHFFEKIHTATHLFNAMSPLHHRHPGLPGAVLLHHSVVCSIVADGYHVDFSMITLAKKLMGERLFLITDAVTETRDGPYPHELKGDKYESNGILSGSALTMMKAVKNCVDHCGIPLDEALRMASFFPSKILGLDRVTGKIEKGYRADLVMMNERLEIISIL